ncbi:MAG: hypothetical protein ACLRVZ_08415 [Turicibacter sp.]
MYYEENELECLDFEDYQQLKWLDYDSESDDELLFDWEEEEAEE